MSDPFSTVGEALAWARTALRAGDNETPALDAAVLLAAVLGCDRVDLYREPERALTETERGRFEQMVRDRLAGRPVAYLTGHREFMGLDFVVTPEVLVPRPETELMVEEALRLMSGGPEGSLVVDVGTGSGAIAVSLARYVRGARVLATDLSEAALTVARLNVGRHRVAVEFLLGDLMEPIPAALAGQIDLIIANLPYIPTAQMDTLPRAVRAEPRLALDGGPDGLDLYRRLVPQAHRFLRPGGSLLFEIAPGQGRAALTIVPSPDWESRILTDLAERERVVIACKSL
ncbi:MAG: peptide chain release factor N(5)-glutamine methyltransferase [Bacillota bacterium]